MTKLIVRIVSGSMTAVAAVTLLLLLTAGQKPVEASTCCEICEANETACYLSCDNDLPPGDERNACYDNCHYYLYEWTYACWPHCVYCTGSSSGSACYTCNTHVQYDDHGGILYWEGPECYAGGSGQASESSFCHSW